jgi:RNase P/RNase MRP subunit p29
MLLAGLCVVGVTLAAMALLRPATGRGDTAGRALATVTSVVSAVRLRPATTLVWNQVTPLDTAFESDVLFVPADGAASLRFTDGTELRLDPNTLIILEPRTDDDTRPAIGLREGSVVGESGDTGLEIHSESGDITVAKSSRVHVVRGKSGTQVRVMEGRADLETAAGTRSVSEHELGGFDGAGTLQPNERPPVTLISPPPQGRVDISNNKPVLLKWRVEGKRAYTLQVARDFEFTTKILETRLRAETVEHHLEVEQAGVYWWRFVDNDGSAQSAPSSFHARAAAPPVLIFPQMNQVVLAPPDRGMVFTWSFVEGCPAYLIEVARDGEFSTVVLSEGVEGPQLWVGHGLDEGHYYWRVRADGCGPAPFSTAGRFRLISKPLLDAPTAMDAEIVDK